MYNFTLRQLIYFTVAAEKGSLKAAAEKLNVAQPSISNAICTLEKNLGVTLFIRHHARGLSLSPYGHTVLQQTQKLLKQADTFNLEVQLNQHNAPLAIGCYSSFAPRILPKLIVKYKKEYPEANISVTEGTQEELTEKVLSGELDIIIIYNFNLSEDLYSQKVIEMQPRALVNANNPIAKKKQVSLKELSEYPFILLDIPTSSEYFKRVFTSHNLDISVSYKAKTIEMVRGLVGQEWGVSLLTSHSKARRTYDGNEVVSIPLEEKTEPSSIHLATSLGGKMHKSGRNFLNFCLQNKDLFE